MSNTDTIFAPACPAGGAIAIVRISGARTQALLRRFFIPGSSGDFPVHRRMTFAEAMDGGELVDTCTLAYYKAPASYTGEDMAEVFTHGSQAVLNRLFTLFSQVEGVRPAEPGEFTKRAFLNGKLDLSGAEAVMDMISASTELSRKAAAYQLAGGLRRRIDALYDELAELASYLDAVMDYPDEMEDEAVEGGELVSRLKHVEIALETLIRNGLASRVLREGARVAIMGEPNSGKSSLLNALLMRDRAIVTELAGTTRDTIEESADVMGVPVVFVDTAGIRSSEDAVEKLGVERALREAELAGLALWLHECGRTVSQAEAEAFSALGSANVIVVHTKTDLEPAPCPVEEAFFGSFRSAYISSRTGEGLDDLRLAIRDALLPTDEQAVMTNSRHISALLSAKASVDSASRALGGGMGLDCCAADIADALQSIGAVTGRTASEDVIDGIFSRFCVGK